MAEGHGLASGASQWVSKKSQTEGGRVVMRPRDQDLDDGQPQLQVEQMPMPQDWLWNPDVLQEAQ